MHRELEKTRNCDSPLHLPTIYLYVFVAPAISLIKFGSSERPHKRLLEAMDGSPVEIRMLGYCRDPEGGRMATWIQASLYEHKDRAGWFRDHEDCRRIANMIVENRPMDLSKFARL